MKNYTEKDRWNILGSHFQTHGFVHHQTESFNHFINVGLTKIITEEPPLVIIKKEEGKIEIETKITINFSDVFLPNPTVIEENRKLRSFYPSEARWRDLTYDSPIYVSVSTLIEKKGEKPVKNKHLRVVIGRLPIMLRSSHCYLTKMKPKDRIVAGECIHDNGGYFIVKGKERVLIAQIRGNYNIPLVFSREPSREKFSFVAGDPINVRRNWSFSTSSGITWIR